MRQLAGEVVGAELIFGILAILEGIESPLRQSAPVLLREACVRALLQHRRGQQEHVAALLQRHPVAIVLAVGIGIHAHIVGCPDLVPVAALGIVEYEVQQGLRDLGVIAQEQRDGGIGHIHGAGASVGEVLLGDEIQVVVPSCYELVGGNGLPVCEGAEVGVLLSSGLGGLLDEAVVEGVQAVAELGPFLGRLCHLLGNGIAAGGVPVGAQLLPEELDGIDVVVGEHQQLFGLLLYLLHVEAPGQGHVFIHEVAGGDGLALAEHLGIHLSGRCEAQPGGFSLHEGQSTLSGYGGHVEVAPIDANVVPALLEHLLVQRTGAEILHTVGSTVFKHDGHHIQVYRNARRDLEIEFHRVFLVVDGSGGEAHIVDRAAEKGEVVHQHGGHKTHLHLHGAAVEGVCGAGGQHIHACLQSGILKYNPSLAIVERIVRLLFRFATEHGVGQLLLVAEKTVGHAIYAHSGDHGLLAACPVPRHVGIRLIGEAPDGEVGIHGHQRIGGCAKVVLVVQGCRRPQRKREQECGKDEDDPFHTIGLFR